MGIIENWMMLVGTKIVHSAWHAVGHRQATRHPCVACAWCDMRVRAFVRHGGGGLVSMQSCGVMLSHG